MLYRKIEGEIEKHLRNNPKEVLLISGARQIGKSFIIRYVGKKMFENFIEIDLKHDSLNDKLFAEPVNTENFYLKLSAIAGDKMKAREDTLVFLDEIQTYPHLLTLLKFLRDENRFTYIASGSLLGVTLSQTTSIPIGSLMVKKMYPLDFEEFLMALGYGSEILGHIREQFSLRRSLSEAIHNKVMDSFKKYLLVGGLPEAVNIYLAERNIISVRAKQNQIYEFYGQDASKYDQENKLKIKRIYDMVPSNLENKKKRVVLKDIEGKKGKRHDDYLEEFDYLINSGIALEVKAISKPVFPLIESSTKNLLKLYINDIGILTNVLYKTNIFAILDDVKSVNLGSVYESVVAQELVAHGYRLFYYDNKTHGEVDYLVDDYNELSILPIEVKSGKDYTVHSALSHFLELKEYNVKRAVVLSNEREVFDRGQITYMPIYYVMCLDNTVSRGIEF